MMCVLPAVIAARPCAQQAKPGVGEPLLLANPGYPRLLPEVACTYDKENEQSLSFETSGVRSRPSGPNPEGNFMLTGASIDVREDPAVREKSASSSESGVTLRGGYEFGAGRRPGILQDGQIFSVYVDLTRPWIIRSQQEELTWTTQKKYAVIYIASQKRLNPGGLYSA